MSKQAIVTIIGAVVLFAVVVAATLGIVGGGGGDSGGQTQTAPGVMTMPGGATMPEQDMTTTAGETTNEMPGMTMP